MHDRLTHEGHGDDMAGMGKVGVGMGKVGVYILYSWVGNGKEKSRIHLALQLVPRYILRRPLELATSSVRRSRPHDSNTNIIRRNSTGSTQERREGKG